MMEEVRKYSINADSMFEKLKKLSETLGFQVDKIDETNRRLMLSTGLSLFSYGETVEVIVNQEKEGSRVYVRSEPKVWFNITAQGNVKRNVEHIFKMLEEAVK